MSEYVIQAEGLGKKYMIGHQTRPRYETLRDAVVDSFTRLGRRGLRLLRSSSQSVSDPGREELWALRDVSFEVKRGDRLGVIGRNGAGKSTLLKILGRITDPTRGRAAIRGRVASLLEVGTGFHPELTGRENIFLNGAILGMSKSEIKSKFDEIVAFSEVERFLDTPLKRYSSGMQVRLAFAVAAHLEPEILVVDEVLAVGDFAFQKKSLGKMRDVAQGGRTVLFVSHDMGAINTLCEKAMLLNAGSIVASGATREIVAKYLDMASGLYSPVRVPVHRGELHLIGVDVTQNGRSTNVINSRQPFTIAIEYENVEVVPGSRLMVILRNQKGEVIFTTSDYDDLTEPAANRRTGRFISTVTIPAKLLKEGSIYATVAADVRNDRMICVVPDVLRADVVDPECDPYAETHRRDGVVAPILTWHMVPVDSSPPAEQSKWEARSTNSMQRVQE